MTMLFSVVTLVLVAGVLHELDSTITTSIIACMLISDYHHCLSI